ncbi:MAG: glycoside hydrolase family 78 protein [Bacteroidia bacterium]
MARILTTLLAGIFPLLVYSQALSDLTCEYKVNPLGIGTENPRFSWKFVSGGENITQKAFEIRIARSESDLSRGRNLFWNSGKIASDQSVNIAYSGTGSLSSATRYFWQVRAWTNETKPGPWSSTAWFETGLTPSDWSAEWIEPGLEEDIHNSPPSPMLRSEFELKGKILSARLYITAHGLYEAHINGQRVGEDLFTPGWTSYNKRLQYQIYDITPMLKQGNNAIGITLGDGWYRGFLVWQNHRNTYGEKLGALAQIEVRYTNGKTVRFSTDNGWKTSTGAILASDIYNGETYDAREEKTGWSLPGYNDTNWKPVSVAIHPKNHLIAQVGPPVRRMEEIAPVSIFKTPKGETVVDFGQNMVGWVKLTAAGQAGTRITLYHAEVLDKEGNFYTDNLRAATQKNEYILKGNGTETFEPHFTFQGFRYVKVEGFPGTITKDNLTGVVIHSAMAPTGNFSCSDSLLNQLQHNIQWGQKGNFVDVPTDCPQRDERLGWTGDAQVFARTAAFNMDVAAFYTKWLGDVAADQTPEGAVPYVIPQVLRAKDVGSAGWADAAVIIPWTVYLTYGDIRILENQYPSMKAWVDFMARGAGEDNLWDTVFTFGDWLFYSVQDDRDGTSAITDKVLIKQAFFAYSTELLIKTAAVIGKKEDVEKYSRLLTSVKEAFRREFVTPSGRLVSNSQTAYVLALNFDLLPESQRAAAAKRLVDNIRSYKNHLTTGFLGTPYLCHVLSRFGYEDVAYDLLMQETYPSWLYPVKMGATTIWERWDGIRPDGTFQNVGMNSFNHYAYGAIGDWMYQHIAGIQIDPNTPGYKKSVIRPRPGSGLTQATGKLQTMYGELSSSWKLEGGKFTLSVTIPPNTTATVFLPKTGEEEKREVGSGTYTFSYDWQYSRILLLCTKISFSWQLFFFWQTVVPLPKRKILITATGVITWAIRGVPIILRSIRLLLTMSASFR